MNDKKISGKHGLLTLSRPARPAFKYPSANLMLMMMDMAVPKTAAAYDYRHLDRIREKFHEIFGTECTLRDDVLMKRYKLSPDGDLIMFIR